VNGVFVTGTDTGVGKTVVAAALLAAAPPELNLGYWKPVQTGDEDDANLVADLVGADRAASVVGPAAHFALAASPHHAAEVEGSHVDVSGLLKAAEALGPRPFLVEGAGGWMVPLNRRELWPDFVEAVDLAVLVVASTRLGCINHTLLTLSAVGRRALGIVLVGPADPSARSGIGAHTNVPILGRLDHVDGFGADEVRSWGDQLWSGPLAQIWKAKVGAW
jgi:dethiobiotin synthase